MENKIEVSILDTDLVIEMIDIIKSLKEKGSFYNSCIELDHDFDGCELEKRIDKLIESCDK